MLKKLLHLGLLLGTAVSPAAAGPMTFEIASSGGNCDGCEWIAAEGEIEPDSADRLAARFGDYRGRIMLNSPGGSPMGAIRLGEFIRTRGLRTSVGKTVPNEEYGDVEKTVAGHCVSSCVLAFLGGTSRYASDGELGVHQFLPISVRPSGSVGRSPGASHSSWPQRETAQIIDHVLRMGADPQFLAKTFSTSPDATHFFTAKEMDELNLVMDEEKHEIWEIEAEGAGVVAFTSNRDKTSKVSIFCRSEDRTPRVRITEPTRLDLDWARSVLKAVTEFTVFHLDVPPTDVDVSIADGKLVAEIKTEALDPERLKVAGNGRFQIQVSIDSARFTWSFLRHDMNGVGASHLARIALQNCI